MDPAAAVMRGCRWESTYVEFCFGFAQSLKVRTVHQKNDAVDGREVVLPHSAGCKRTYTKTNKQKQNKVSPAALAEALV